MKRIASQIKTSSPEFAANAERMRGLVSELKERVALARAGGPEHARELHTKRGKLLPRQTEGYPSYRHLCRRGGPHREVAGSTKASPTPQPRPGRPARATPASWEAVPPIPPAPARGEAAGVGAGANQTRAAVVVPVAVCVVLGTDAHCCEKGCTTE